MMNVEISAVILAGGKATRMGGNDKGLIEIDGQPLVKIISSQIQNQVSILLINANRNLPRYRQLGFNVVEDDLSDYQGPLAGMLAALKVIRTDWLITLPCDGPYIAKDYVEKMIGAVEESGFNIAVASNGERLQPVYALIHRKLTTSLAAYLDSGERKIDRWYKEVGFNEVVFSTSSNMFTNLNTPEELAMIENQTID